MSTALLSANQRQKPADPFSRDYSPRSAALTTIGSVEINSYPPGLGYGAWRTSIASLSYNNKTGSQLELVPGLAVKRPVARPPTAGRRAIPPLPPSTLPVPSREPFVDASDSQLAFLSQPNVTVACDSHPTRPRRGAIYHPQPTTTRSEPLSFALTSLPTRPPLPDKNARSRLVAGILLHRVHAVGKPMRRRPGECQVPRGYVRSGLSTMITFDSGEN